VSRGARFRAVAPLVLTGLLLAGLMVTLVGVAADPGFDVGVESGAFVLAIAMWAVLQSLVGTIIVWQRPHNRIGRIMQAGGPLLLGVFLGYLVGAWRYTTVGPDDVIGGIGAWWGSSTILISIFVALPLVGLLFPDGELPSSRFAWPLRAVVVGLVVPSVLFALQSGPVDAELPTNPFGVLPFSQDVRELLGLISTVALIGGLALAVGAVITRWRRGDPLERAQLKWLLGAFAISPVLFAISWAGPDVGPSDYIDAMSAVSASLVPIAIGIAVLRYRLYEIDRLASRTITYGLVTAVLFGVFLTVTVVMGSAIGATGDDALTTAVSTLVAAALFNPVRSRVQRLVDRRFNRARYDAQQTASGFADRLRHQLDLPMLSEELRRATIQTVEPQATSVWLRPRRSP
jgi:hypothetical protein